MTDPGERALAPLSGAPRHDAERVIRARMASPTPPGGMRGTREPGSPVAGVA